MKVIILFSVLRRCVLRHSFKLILLLVLICIVLCMMTKSKVHNARNSSKAKQNRNGTRMVNATPSTVPITLFVRMAGKLKKHRTRFYCDLFRTAVLFWPASFGTTVVVLDEESEQDHVFAKNLTRQIKQRFPDRKFKVVYESLPKDESVLNFPSSPKSAGYNRQLWSSFFIDLYTNEPIVAWMDTDAAFVAPVTKSTIFNGSRIRILGSERCHDVRTFLELWRRSTKRALGLPMVANFMTYFPAYLYRDTFTHCREFILKRFNTSNFEEAFKKFYHDADSWPGSVVIIISYAWFFERNRYDWNIKLCSKLMSYNKRFPVGHKIASQHTNLILSQPQTAYHVPYFKGSLFPNILDSYCLSHESAGNQKVMCTNHSVSAANNLVLFNHDLHTATPSQTPCTASKKNDCLKILEHHYYQVGLEIRNGRRMDWKDLKTVESLANDVDIICSNDITKDTDE